MGTNIYQNCLCVFFIKEIKDETIFVGDPKRQSPFKTPLKV